MNLAVSRKDETRRRIVETAARLFMEKGVDRVGVDEIMRECGLTHGGFYSYFPSKEALFSEACVQALGQTARQWEDLLHKVADDGAWAGFVETYLAGDLTSENNPVCPAAILGADVARRPGAVQDAYVAQLRALIDRIAGMADGDRSFAILVFAALVGATSLAAQVGQDKELAAEILNGTREELKKGHAAAERTQQSA